MKGHCIMKETSMKTPKTPIINPFLIPALLAVVNLIPVGRVTAQTFTTLHSFTATTNGGPPYYFVTNSDGAQPWGRLITNSSGNTLYGTAKYGSSWGVGAIFAVNTDGTGFTSLYSFTANIGPGYTDYTNNDGAYPIAGLVLSGHTLYGTARAGGTHKAGTVFAVNTDGTGFTNLHTFAPFSIGPPYPRTNSEGGAPFAGVILSDNTLYGTTYTGGSSGKGTVFAVNTDGTGFTNLHSLAGGDGAAPYAQLVLSGNTLYGTALNSGIAGGNGTVFSLSFAPQ